MELVTKHKSNLLKCNSERTVFPPFSFWGALRMTPRLLWWFHAPCQPKEVKASELLALSSARMKPEKWSTFPLIHISGLDHPKLVLRINIGATGHSSCPKEFHDIMTMREFVCPFTRNKAVKETGPLHHKLWHMLRSEGVSRAMFSSLTVKETAHCGLDVRSCPNCKNGYQRDPWQWS